MSPHEPMPVRTGGVSRTSVFSPLTEVRRLLKRMANRHGTVHETFAPNRSQTSSFVPFSFSQRSSTAEQSGRENDTQTNDMVTKKPEALLTPKAQAKGHEHAGSSAQTGWERAFILWHERQIVAGETWLVKGSFPRMLRDRKQPFIRHYWLCSNTSALQPAITAQMNTHVHTH